MSAAMPLIALVRREFLTALRRTRAFALLLLTIGCAFIFTLMGIWASLRYDGMISPNENRSTFMVLSLVLYAAAGLFPLVIGAASICVERQQESYDLLATSLLRPVHIILAKWFNAVGFFLLLFVATMPLVGVLFFFVGIEWGAFFRSMSVTLLTACASAAIGLRASVLFKRPVSAIAGAFITMLVFLGALTLAFALVFDGMRIRPLSGFLQDTFVIWSPFASVVGSWERIGGNDQFFPGLLYQLIWIVLCLLTAWASVRRADAGAALGASRVLPRGLRRRTASFFGPPQLRPLISDSVNPMYAKEMRSGVMSRPRVAWITFLIASGAVLFLNGLILRLAFRFYGLAQTFHSSHFSELLATILFQGVFILFLLPALAASVYVKDQELGNSDLLRGTLLHPGEVIRGKSYAIVMCMLPWAGALAVGMLYCVLYTGDYPPRYSALLNPLLGTLGIGLLVCFAYVLAISLACAVYCRRTVTAVVSAYVVNIGVLGLLPLFLAFVFDEAFNIRRAEIVWTWVSPVIAQLYYATQNNTSTRPASFYTLYWTSNVLFFGVFSFVIFRCAARRFARRAWRDR